MAFVQIGASELTGDLEVGNEVPMPVLPGEADVDVPTIRLRAGRLDLAADAAAKALVAAHVPIYRRGDRLVRPSMEVVDAADGAKTVTAKFRDVCSPALTYTLARHTIFERYDLRSKAWVSIDPSEKVAAMLMSGVGDWPLPTVAGIITAPTLRPDGSLLSQPGYDLQTRLYLVEDPGLRLPPIPEAPTRDEALAALETILTLLAEFPFVGPEDQAVALSGILTTVSRPALMASPLHAIRAHTPGTGKSYLVDIASAFAIGRRCPVIAAGRTEEETEKRLGAMLMAGMPIVSIDNVNGELGGDALCQITERPLVRVRVLGKSETVEIESRATVFATGNNLILVADMTRRTLLCRLDAGVERPEIREFQKKPVDLVLQDRGTFLAAALTILRAYQVAGRPNQLPRLASYEQWSDTVRSALVWLGQADPVATMEATREGDPEAQAIRQLYAHWRETLTLSAGYTSAQLIAQANVLDGPMGDGVYLHEEFRDLLVRQAGEGRTISTKRLGKWLTRVCGRVFDGVRLEVRTDPSNGNKYSLRRVDDAPMTGSPDAEAAAAAYRRASQGV
ncbi:hypothetical protein [Methylobacterium sp. WCS2018Hpa-22]|uniref:hypothetical protein n=1 Tax=Methylobacterium sp. WCS2018Hpa-22 TaxID=3073633 RepID=UPI0028897CB6|nr:hypothetical protein [Methylobacterium sp. WCS2018Hpa-22]